MIINYMEAKEAIRDIRHALAETMAAATWEADDLDAEEMSWDSYTDARAELLMTRLIAQVGFYRHSRIEGSTHQLQGSIPLSTSVNAAYATNAAGKRVRSAALAEFKKAAADKLAQINYIYHRNPMPEGQVYRLTLWAYFGTEAAIQNRDADNLIKAAQDCIMKAVRVDDRWIYSVTAIKAGVDPIQSRIEFALEVLQGDQLAAGLLAQPGRKG